MDMIRTLAQEFSLRPEHAENIVALIDAGNTIPFIARYRKEMTGSCDDQVLRAAADRLSYLRSLEKRKGEVAETIRQQEKMTEALEKAIEGAKTLSEVEDLYRPYRPKRRTRATIAEGRGLAPLADLILAQTLRSGTAADIAAPYVDAEKDVPTWEDAVQGAGDIIAERMSDDAACRTRLRALFYRKGVIVSVKKKDEPSVYEMYYEYSEPVGKIPSHRILAINRGEREEYLKVTLEIPGEEAVRILTDRFVLPGSVTSGLVVAAAEDAWKRLILPSVEREVRGELTDKAAEQAIRMFALNLKPLLMQPPVKGHVIMGFDPGNRTGCKIAVIGPTGRALDTAVVYPTPPQNKTAESERVLTRLIQKHGVTLVAIGNGTASKESEIFIAGLIKKLDTPLRYVMVSEAGASVYSASKLAAEEFPEYDVSLRSAVSIARRLLDPLAELVKIDPKAIGVGQYQHDLPQARLDTALTGVIEDCVNSVGVDVNTASAPLLTYIAGLGPAVSKNIVAYRDENGDFKQRADLKKVPKLGPKAFEQCAGFLRIPGGKNVLDNTAVHPESYAAAKKLLALFGAAPGAGAEALSDKVAQYGEARCAEAVGVGVPTLRDMLSELSRPGRDIRETLPMPELRSDILSLSDLKAGMRLTGTVRNVIDFGAFVDIGVHQDGLVHISEMADRYIQHPSEVARVGDVVTVTVLAVDEGKKRISLTMRENREGKR